jgi:hypothetical protein
LAESFVALQGMQEQGRVVAGYRIVRGQSQQGLEEFAPGGHGIGQRGDDMAGQEASRKGIPEKSGEFFG